MREGFIERSLEKSGDAGTFSHLAIRKAGCIDVVTLQLVTGELPWRDDKKDISCLPPALPAPGVASAEVVYLLRYLFSNAHKKSNYRFVSMRMPDGSWGPIPDGRTVAEIHAANLMGDIFKGFGAQVEGCVAPGLEFATFPKGAEFHSFTAASPENLLHVSLTKDQLGVSGSQDALAQLEKELAGEDLVLTVRWV